MNDHVAKPVDPERLFEALARWLSPQCIGWPAEPLNPVTSQPPPAVPLSAPKLPGLLDFDGLLRRFGGRLEFVTKLVRSSLEYYAETPLEIRRLIAAKDFAEIGRIAHGLKGTGGNLMAPRLRDLAQKMQAMAQTQDAAALETAHELQLTLETLLEECQRWLNESAQNTELP